MRTDDFMVKSLFAMFGIIILGGVTLCIIRECNCSKVSATAKQVLIQERIEESKRGDVWRTSIYRLDSVIYDTIPKKITWDTAHELPR